jgi:hypothetical protein
MRPEGRALPKPRRRGTVRIPLLAAIAALLIAPAAQARGGARRIPFPTEKTTILREEGVVYTVSGRVKIPKGVEISCQKDVKVVAEGPDAVIEVEGALKVHGVSDREVIFEGVTIELAPEFLDVHLDMAIFRKGARVGTPADTPVRGKLFVENVDFNYDAGFDVTFCHGSVDLSSIDSDVPMRVAAVCPEGAEENKVKLKVRGCVESLHSGYIGLKGGLVVSGVYDVTVRINRIGGLASFSDCRTLIFDGNKVDAKKLVFRAGAGTDFRRTKVTKCDLYCETVEIVSVAGDEKNLDRVLLDRCYFRGLERPDEVRTQVIRDGEGEEENVVQVRLGKIGTRPLELAGPWIR